MDLDIWHVSCRSWILLGSSLCSRFVFFLVQFSKCSAEKEFLFFDLFSYLKYSLDGP